jgi:gamma-glutamyltranspeptidase/glutathione hydrolase
VDLNQGNLARNNSKTFGMAASGSQLATKAGVDILKKGGNAADACLTMAGVLNVTLPMSCGLGGDLFLLYYCAAEKKVYSLNGAGPAPAKINAEYFINSGYSSLPLLGIISSAVPSAPAAYSELLNKFASMSLKKLWQPAIQYAIDGFEVTPQLSRWFKNCQKTALNDRNLLDMYYKNGEFYNSGEILQQKKLGVTLEKVANQGTNFFYQGEIAEKLIATSNGNNGFFTKEDLSNFSVQFEEPLQIKFKENYIYQNPLPSQGFMMLLTLKVLENINICSEADLIHYMVETVKCINQIRGNFVGDPKFVSVDLDDMFSDSMIKYITNQISYDKAKNIKKSNSNYFYGDTTYFYSIDQYGNICSCIASLSLGFGAGITIGDTGIILNNRVGRGFTMHPSHPNCIQGGKDQSIH